MGIIIALESILDPLLLERVFPAVRPVELELGAGDGGFLVEWAALRPEHNFIGVERLLGRLRKIERRAVRRGLVNVRVVRLEASYFVKYLVPVRSVGALHVYFPDPWPKRKHWRHRLVNEQFPALAERVLIPGGSVYLRTDHEEYFAQMNRVFAAHGGFVPQETPAILAAVPTDFERGFRAAGVEVFRAAFAVV
ncbi:MAG: tRNA (guanosine(46)-N7)-methyltransferase TrmB [Verrucomicrobia bacterium]|nr:tRNA (guanosine(46)-N7)-methyltransferase TrmB [Verrucomicrobiota bacterium]